MKSLFLFCIFISTISNLFGQFSDEKKMSYFFKSLEDSAIDKPHADTYGHCLGWTMYKDIMFPGTSIFGSMKNMKRKFPNTSVLSCKITGGDAYNNMFYTYTFAKSNKKEEWEFSKTNEFDYSLDFYVESEINCDTPNLSELEGLEFTFQIAKPPVSYLWGLQWSKSSTWCYWDDTKVNGKTKGWIRIPNLKLCMKQNEWNQIRMTGHRTSNGLYYDTMILNGKSIALNIFVPRAYLPVTWSDNYLQTGFQINGNKAIRKDHSHSIDPVMVYLKNVDLEVRKR